MKKKAQKRKAPPGMRRVGWGVRWKKAKLYDQLGDWFNVSKTELLDKLKRNGAYELVDEIVPVYVEDDTK